MIFIGIDPGAAGGLVVLKNRSVLFLAKMPATERDLLDCLEPWNPDRHPGAFEVRAVLEHVWSTPGQGGAFKFGLSVGYCRMALTAARIPFDQVLPKRWQQALGIVYRKGMTDVEKKNLTKRRAQQLFPALTITHAIADALLMAEYCRRVHTGAINGEAKDAGAQVYTEAQRNQEDEGRKAGRSPKATAREAAGAHPGDSHQAARHGHRHVQRSARHDRGGVERRQD